MKQGWKKYLFYATYILIGGGLLYGLLQLVLAGYSYSWTGFEEYITSKGDAIHQKKLWDWMELLIIPAVLAGGAILLNRSERALERKTAEDRAKLERDLATDRQQEAALQTYFDRMSELLLKEKLRTTKKAEVRDVARTRTLSIMRVLDTKRNKLIIQFLRESQLIIDEKSILNGANMEGMNLEMLNLSAVYMQSAIMRGANLQNADLYNSSLTCVILQGANLQGAYLAFANLRGAILGNANLQGATLGGTDLQGASLAGANLQGAKATSVEQLAEVKSLKGATMPDGTKHE